MKKFWIGCLILGCISHIGNDVIASQGTNIGGQTVRRAGFYTSLKDAATKALNELTPKNLSSLWQYVPYDKKNLYMDNKFACVRAFVDTASLSLFLQSNSEDGATFCELTTRVGASGCKLWQTKFWESIKEKQWFENAKSLSRSFSSNLKQLMIDVRSDTQNIKNICESFKNDIEKDQNYKQSTFKIEDFSVEKLKKYTDDVLATKIYAITREIYSSMNAQQK